MNKKINIVNGQTMLDIVIENYGTIERMVDVIGKVDSVVGKQPTNQEIELEGTRDNAVTRYFAPRRAVATFQGFDEIAISTGQFIQTPEGENVLDEQGNELIFI